MDRGDQACIYKIFPLLADTLHQVPSYNIHGDGYYYDFGTTGIEYFPGGGGRGGTFAVPPSVLAGLSLNTVGGPGYVTVSLA